MSVEELVCVPAAGEVTIISFWKGQAGELGSDARHVLNFLARALIERGWLPSLGGLMSQLEDDLPTERLAGAFRELRRRRLIRAADGRLTSLLGGLTMKPTPHRAHLATGVDVHTCGGMELLCVEPMLAKPVDAFTACGACGAELHVRIEDEQIVATNRAGFAGFQANWDGVSPLDEVAERSPLFCGDGCLGAWTSALPDIEGLPVVADLMLFVGMQMAKESGLARFEMIRHG